MERVIIEDKERTKCIRELERKLQQTQLAFGERK